MMPFDGRSGFDEAPTTAIVAAAERRFLISGADGLRCATLPIVVEPGVWPWGHTYGRRSLRSNVHGMASRDGRRVRKPPKPVTIGRWPAENSEEHERFRSNDPA